MILTDAWTAVKMAMVRYRPRKESATKPPRRQSMKEVPMKLVTTLADSALPRCMVPVRYVTRFTAMPSVVSRSFSSATAAAPQTQVRSQEQPMHYFSSFSTFSLDRQGAASERARSTHAARPDLPAINNVPRIMAAAPQRPVVARGAGRPLKSQASRRTSVSAAALVSGRSPTIFSLSSPPSVPTAGGRRGGARGYV